MRKLKFIKINQFIIRDNEIGVKETLWYMNQI